MATFERPPSSTRVGVRVRIKSAHQCAVERLFSEAGIEPIYKEMRADGVVSYWFGREHVHDLASTGVLERIPLEYWAGRMIFGAPPI